MVRQHGLAPIRAVSVTHQRGYILAADRFVKPEMPSRLEFLRNRAFARAARDAATPPKAPPLPLSIGIMGACSLREVLTMSAMFDRFTKRYQQQQEKKRRDEAVVSDDDAPVPDAPVEQAKADDTPGRNDPCPCGSGKKFKKCCGKAS
jgi:hypothetical protein